MDPEDDPTAMVDSLLNKRVPGWSVKTFDTQDRGGWRETTRVAAKPPFAVGDWVTSEGGVGRVIDVYISDPPGAGAKRQWALQMETLDGKTRTLWADTVEWAPDPTPREVARDVLLALAHDLAEPA